LQFSLVACSSINKEKVCYNFEKRHQGEASATNQREQSYCELTVKRLVQSLDHISAPVTTSEEDDPNLYRNTLRRKMIGRVSAYQESAQKTEKTSRFFRLYLNQNTFSGLRPTFNIMRENNAS
jgi:hypothetical protein